MGQLAINLIEKERIPELHFNKQEVLTNDQDKRDRGRLLHMAMLLGNGYKNKVKIIFNSITGTSSVETTIWATTDQNVILKGGIFIPICCIMQVVI
jgi:hypothetical protein